GQSLINFKDNASGQSFAQAFDAVATQVRSGVKPFIPGATPGTQILNPAFQIQPWFENNIPSAHCVTPSSAPTPCSASLAVVQSSNFINVGLSSIFSTIDGQRMLASLPTFNNYLAQGIFFRSSTGEANYHALLVTVDKRVSRGLTFTANYTFSHSLDQ